MPGQLTDEARETLKKLFVAVADRAFRLKEWITYQDKLRLVQNSFTTVAREADNGILPGQGFTDQTVFPRIKNSWDTCRRVNIFDLQTFHESVNYIDKPLNSGTGVVGRIRYDVKKLLDLQEQINVDIAKVGAMELRQHCSELDAAIALQLANIATSVASEMQELCDLTRSLHEKLA